MRSSAKAKKNRSTTARRPGRAKAWPVTIESNARSGPRSPLERSLVDERTGDREARHPPIAHQGLEPDGISQRAHAFDDHLEDVALGEVARRGALVADTTRSASCAHVSAKERRAPREVLDQLGKPEDRAARVRLL